MTLQQTKITAILIGVSVIFYFTIKIYRFFKYRHARRFFLENGFTTTKKVAVYKTQKIGEQETKALSHHKDVVVYPKIKIKNENIVISNFNSSVLPENISLKSANNMLGSLVKYKPIVEIRYSRTNEIIFYTKEKTLEKKDVVHQRKKDEIVLGADLLTGSLEHLDYKDYEHSLFLSGLPNSGKSFSANSILGQFLDSGFKVYIVSSKAKVDFKDPRIEKRIVPNVEKPEQNQELITFIDEQYEILRKKKTRVENSNFTNLKHIETEKTVYLFDEMWAFAKLEKQVQQKVLTFVEFLIRESRYLNSILLMSSQSLRSSEIPVPFKMVSVILSGKTDTAESSESVFNSRIAFDTPLKAGELILKRAGREPKLIRVFSKVE